MRHDKTFLFEEVGEQIEKYDSFVVAEYKAVPANTIAQFRNQIADKGGEVQMIKKRIFIKAAEAAGMEFKHDLLSGHICLVFSGGDAIDTVKATFAFSKEAGNVFNVLGGRIDQCQYNAKEVETLSTLPGLQEMRSLFLGVLQAPMQQTVSTMQAILTSVIYCLKHKGEKEGE